MSDSLPPLPDFSPSFRPRWQGDNGGFTADQMQAYAAAAVAQANERQNAAWRLMCEKMVAAERERCAIAGGAAADAGLGGFGVAMAIRATET